MNIFIFCHGFGFDKNFWQKLTPYFSKEEIILLDMGYFYAPENLPPLEEANFIGVGHSLGLTQLLNLPIKFNKIIGLNSFINYLGYDKKLNEQRLRELTLLTKNIVRDPALQLTNFMCACGIAELAEQISSKKINDEKLLNDLQLLKTPSKLPDMPTLMINSADDIIVPLTLLDDNFKYFKPQKQIIIEDGKHALGWLHPEKIYAEIMSFINVTVP